MNKAEEDRGEVVPDESSKRKKVEIEQEHDPFHGNVEQALRLIERAQLVFSEPIPFRNASYELSDLFKIDRYGRVGFVFKLHLQGKVYLRVGYRSNSQGTFRVLPAINLKKVSEELVLAGRSARVPEFDKGVTEYGLDLPYPLQKVLALKLHSIREDLTWFEGHEIFYASALQNGSLDAWTTYHSQVKNLFREKPLLTESLDQRPESIDFVDTNLKPDFAQKLDQFESQSSTSGTVSVAIYGSRDGGISYGLFGQASESSQDKTRYWIGAISSLNSDIGIFGVPVEVYRTGRLASPLWEYTNQIVLEFVGKRHEVLTQYSYNWKYNKRIPLIGEFYEALGQEMPASQSQSLSQEDTQPLTQPLNGE